MKKAFRNIEVLNIYSYVNQLTKEKADELPLKFRWNLKKNMDKFRPIAERYEAFRNEQLQQLQKSWFNDEKSEEFMQPKTDEAGNPVLDADGNQETETMRKIKDEFIDDYKKATEELNAKLSEIAFEDNIVDIATVDFDSFVDSLPEDSHLDFDDLTMLSFQDTSTNLVNENTDNKEAE